MSARLRPRRSLLARHQWALWVFLLLLAGTAGFFWLLGRDLRLERIKEKPVKPAARAATQATPAPTKK